MLFWFMLWNIHIIHGIHIKIYIHKYSIYMYTHIHITYIIVLVKGMEKLHSFGYIPRSGIAGS
jgi:hypothetical protein